MSDPRPLHEMEPTRRFSDRVRDYVLYRPTYPLAAAEAVIHGLGPPRDLSVADIGAGTGIFTRVLAETGAKVIAVEPNPEMREAGAHDARCAGRRIEWCGGTAEATGLPAESVNAVACAQAFHWFRAAEALAEFARILAPRGRVALVWNDRDSADPLSAGYSRLIETASGGHAAANDHTRPQALFASALFTGAQEQTFRHAQKLDRAGLVGRAMSASYIPRSGPAHAALEQGLDELFQQHQRDGHIQLAYVTRVFLAERR